MHSLQQVACFSEEVSKHQTEQLLRGAVPVAQRVPEDSDIPLPHENHHVAVKGCYSLCLLRSSSPSPTENRGNFKDPCGLRQPHHLLPLLYKDPLTWVSSMMTDAHCTLTAPSAQASCSLLPLPLRI